MVFKTAFAPIPGGFSAIIDLRRGETVIQRREIANLSSDANDNISLSLDGVPVGTFSILVRFFSISTGLVLADATFSNVVVIAGSTTTISEPPVMNRAFDEDRDDHNNVDEIRVGTDPRNPNIFPFRLTVTKTGNGTVTSSPSGINCGADCTEPYFPGKEVTLTPIPVSGSLFVGWGGECSGTSTCTVVMSAARNVTATFSSPVNLSANSGQSSSPEIAISGSTALVTWADFTPGNNDIFLSRSTDGGVTFASPVNLSANPGQSSSPQIAISSATTVLVTWVDDTSGNNDILLSRSTDGGVTFASPVINLSANVGGSFSPQIAVFGSTVLVTWQDNTSGNFDIFLAISFDGGATFGAPTNISVNSGSSFRPQIAISGSTALVAWTDDTPGNFDIFVVLFRAGDGGATFLDTSRNISANAGFSSNPQIAISGSTILVTWEDGTPGNSDIFLARSTDGGAIFASTVNLSANVDGSLSPQIATSGSTILVTWRDLNSTTSANGGIFLSRSINGGATFSSPAKLSADGSALNPQIAISGSTVLVTWADFTPGNLDIFLSRSTDGGATFASLVNLSANSGGSSNSQIAISGSTALVTWEDQTLGNFDIFFSRMEFP